MNEMSRSRSTGSPAPTPTASPTTWSPATWRRWTVGQVVYTPWCDHDGKVVSRRPGVPHREQDFRISGGRLSRWLEQLADGFEVEITDETAELAILALQGPAAA